MDVYVFLFVLLFVIAILIWNPKRYYGGQLQPLGKKRVPNEIKKLIDTYKDVKHSSDLQTIDIKNGTYVINLPDAYPFKPPTINGLTINEQWWHVEMTLQKLLQLFDKKTFLVYCHPRQINLADPSTHFMVPYFNKFLADKKIGQNDVSMMTLDNQEQKNTAIFNIDGFADNFLQKNTEKFDIVCLPDCGGPWFKLQGTNSDYNTFIDLIVKISNIVKKGGFLILGKFLNFTAHDVMQTLKDKNMFTEVTVGTDLIEIKK